MSRFVVESGIPIGPVSQGKCAYPFDEMKFGDSFFVAVNSPASQKRTRDQLTGLLSGGANSIRLKMLGM